MIINGQKWSCETCIKGHRASSCEHRNRQLTMIKKKGRPATQCPKCRELRLVRHLHRKCDCETAIKQVEKEWISDAKRQKKNHSLRLIAPKHDMTQELQLILDAIDIYSPTDQDAPILDPTLYCQPKDTLEIPSQSNDPPCPDLIETSIEDPSLSECCLNSYRSPAGEPSIYTHLPSLNIGCPPSNEPSVNSHCPDPNEPPIKTHCPPLNETNMHSLGGCCSDSNPYCPPSDKGGCCPTTAPTSCLGPPAKNQQGETIRLVTCRCGDDCACIGCDAHPSRAMKEGKKDVYVGFSEPWVVEK